MKGKVAIVTINWNGLADTSECLKSLRKMDHPNYEVIVVDNASTDGSQKALAESFPEVKLIENRENVGVALGYNMGIQYGLDKGADYILLLNNDTILKEDAVSQLVNVLEKEGNLALAAAVVYNYYKPEEVEHYGLYADLNTGFSKLIFKNSAYNCLSGCALMARSKFIREVGLLDERYFIYGEDKDWCFRFTRKGYSLTVVDEAIVWHRHSAASGGVCSPTSLYYSIRNDRLFCEKLKKRTWMWLVKDYIPGNLKIYHNFFKPQENKRTAAILLGLYDGCRQHYGKKRTGKVKENTFRAFAFVINHTLEKTKKIKRLLKSIISRILILKNA